MDFVYLLVNDGCEWEDIKVYLSKELAIEKSKRQFYTTNTRVKTKKYRRRV